MSQTIYFDVKHLENVFVRHAFFFSYWSFHYAAATLAPPAGVIYEVVGVIMRTLLENLVLNAT